MFEKTPSYIQRKVYLERIRNVVPSVKIVILLRNPVVRAVSAFRHHCRHGEAANLKKEETLNSIDSLTVYSFYLGRYYRVEGSIVRNALYDDKALHDRVAISSPCSTLDLLHYYQEDPFGRLNQSELDVGYYADQVKNAITIFGKGNVLVLFQEVGKKMLFLIIVNQFV